MDVDKTARNWIVRQPTGRKMHATQAAVETLVNGCWRFCRSPWPSAGSSWLVHVNDGDHACLKQRPFDLCQPQWVSTWSPTVMGYDGFNPGNHILNGFNTKPIFETNILLSQAGPSWCLMLSLPKQCPWPSQMKLVSILSFFPDRGQNCPSAPISFFVLFFFFVRRDTPLKTIYLFFRHFKNGHIFAVEW